MNTVETHQPSKS